MEETRLALLKSVSATVSGGTATAVLSNNGLARWEVKLFNTTTTSTTQTRCTVYRQEALPRNQIDYTRTGNGDTSPTDITLRPGEYLTIVWTLGSAGAVCTFSIEGDEILRGRRAY